MQQTHEKHRKHFLKNQVMLSWIYMLSCNQIICLIMWNQFSHCDITWSYIRTAGRLYIWLYIIPLQWWVPPSAQTNASPCLYSLRLFSLFDHTLPKTTQGGCGYHIITLCCWNNIKPRSQCDKEAIVSQTLQAVNRISVNGRNPFLKQASLLEDWGLFVLESVCVLSLPPHVNGLSL